MDSKGHEFSEQAIETRRGSTPDNSPLHAAAAEFKYFAFLSYSSRQRRFAIQLQRTLEAYRVPKPLIDVVTPHGKIQKRLGKIFRDQTDMASAPDLTSEIERALANSFALIVVCSPETATLASWVNREVEAFRRLRRDGPILPVLVDGEPSECFPPSLKTQILDDGTHIDRPEPLAADFRKGVDSRIIPRLKLIAGLLGLEFDLLRRRHESSARRRRRLLASIGFAYVATITLVGVGLFEQTINLAHTNSKVISEVVRSLISQGRYDVASLLSIVALSPPGSLVERDPDAEAVAISAAAKNRLLAEIPVHSASIWAMALEPTERRIALTAAGDGEIAFTDLDRTIVLLRQKAHGDSALAAAFSSNGVLAATGSKNEIVIWDVAKLSIQKRIPMPGLDVRSIAFVPKSDVVLVGGMGGVFLVDLKGETEARQLVDPKRRVMAVAASTDGLLGLAGTYDSQLTEFSLPDGNIIAERVGAGTVTSALYDDSTNTWITTRALVPTATVWAPVQLQRQRDIALGQIGSNIALDNDILLSGTWENSIRLVEKNSGANLSVIQSDNWIDGVAFLSNDRIVSADHYGRLRVWVKPGTALKTDIVPIMAAGPGALAVSRDGSLVVAGDIDGSIRIRDLDTKEYRQLQPEPSCQARADTLKRGIKAVSISQERTKLAYITNCGELVVATLPEGRELWRRSTEGIISAVAFAGDDNVATGSEDGRLILWDAVRGVPVREAVLDSRAAIGRLLFNRKADKALVAAGPQLITWAPASSVLTIHKDWRHDRAIMSLAWSDDGSTIATGGASDGIFVGQASAMAPDRLLPSKNSNWIFGLGISSDGRIVASGSNDGDLVLWDARSGIQIDARPASSNAPSPGVLEVALTKDGKRLYYRTSAGVTGAWDTSILRGDIFRAACDNLPIGRRSFTAAEMREFAFLGEGERSPCRRGGIFTTVYWRAKMSFLGL